MSAFSTAGAKHRPAGGLRGALEGHHKLLHRKHRWGLVSPGLRIPEWRREGHVGRVTLQLRDASVLGKVTFAAQEFTLGLPYPDLLGGDLFGAGVGTRRLASR